MRQSGSHLRKEGSLSAGKSRPAEPEQQQKVFSASSHGKLQPLVTIVDSITCTRASNTKAPFANGLSQLIKYLKIQEIHRMLEFVCYRKCMAKIITVFVARP